MRKLRGLIGTSLFFCMYSVAFGDVVILHNGNTDPTSQGWVDSGGSQTASPVTEMGVDAWSVDDSSTAGGSFKAYLHQLSNAQISQAMSQGWTLSTRVRVVDVDDTVDFSVSANFNADTINYGFAFGSQADGDPIVMLPTSFDGLVPDGLAFALEGSGGGYHQYDLVFDPDSNTADLFVDGIERISDYGGYTFVSGEERISWGAQQSNSIGHGNFNSVVFSVVPEPSAVLLVLTASMVIGTGRRRV